MLRGLNAKLFMKPCRPGINSKLQLSAWNEFQAAYKTMPMALVNWLKALFKSEPNSAPLNLQLGMNSKLTKRTVPMALIDQ
jgi:hypothetical protein